MDEHQPKEFNGERREVARVGGLLSCSDGSSGIGSLNPPFGIVTMTAAIDQAGAAFCFLTQNCHECSSDA
jgi:hypothetical protein